MVCPLKNIPPIRNLTLVFFGSKKLWSNVTAVVEVVSLTTFTLDPYLVFNPLSMLVNKAKLAEPIGTYKGEALAEKAE